MLMSSPRNYFIQHHVFCFFLSFTLKGLYSWHTPLFVNSLWPSCHIASHLFKKTKHFHVSLKPNLISEPPSLPSFSFSLESIVPTFLCSCTCSLQPQDFCTQGLLGQKFLATPRPLQPGTLLLSLQVSSSMPTPQGSLSRYPRVGLSDTVMVVAFTLAAPVTTAIKELLRNTCLQEP